MPLPPLLSALLQAGASTTISGHPQSLLEIAVLERTRANADRDERLSNIYRELIAAIRASELVREEKRRLAAEEREKAEAAARAAATVQLKKAVEAKSDRTLKRDELERGFNLHFHAPPGEEQARRLPGTLANPAASAAAGGGSGFGVPSVAGMGAGRVRQHGVGAEYQQSSIRGGQQHPQTQQQPQKQPQQRRQGKQRQRGGWTKEPPAFILGANGPVKIVKAAASGAGKNKSGGVMGGRRGIVGAAAGAGGGAGIAGAGIAGAGIAAAAAGGVRRARGKWGRFDLAAERARLYNFL